MSAFKFKSENDVFTIQFPAIMDSRTTDEFRVESKGWLLQVAQNFVFDFSTLINLDVSSYQVIIPFASLLRDHKKPVYVVGASSLIKNQFTNDRIATHFKFISSVSEITALRSAHKIKLDVDFINPFIEATLRTLDIQCTVKSHPGKPYLKTSDVLPVEIVGVLTLICEKFDGSIRLCFPKPVFLKIYEKMLGEVHTEISQEIQDAVCELLNIIYGAAKTELNAKKQFNFQPALPRVLVGEKIREQQRNFGLVIVLPFESDAGIFHIEISGTGK